MKRTPLAAIAVAALAVAACSSSPTAKLINGYCDSGKEAELDAAADAATDAANSYFRGRGGRFTIKRAEVVCDEE